MKTTSLKMNIAFSLCIAAMAMFTSCSTPRNSEATQATPIRVACVGDSITYGYGFSNRDRESYPAQLQGLLGNRWEVRNFGFNGATALKKGTKPYSSLSVYSEALSYKPDVVIIKLGTNDTNAKTWPSYKDEFIADYMELIRSFQGLETKPRIYLCRPVPLFRDRGKEYDTDKILTEEVIPKINAIARKEKLPIIDLYVAFEGKSQMFPDGVHPDANGTRIMAQVVSAKLLSRK